MELTLNSGETIKMPRDATISDLLNQTGAIDVIWNDLYLLNLSKNKTFKIKLVYADLSLPFYQIFEKYTPKKNAKVKYDYLQVYKNINIKCHKTIRIPNDDTEYPLPPTLGKYKIENKNNNLSICMRPEEAMWISFEQKNLANYAVKVGAGSLNAISGKIFDAPLEKTNQNYLCLPEQPWLDGYNVGNSMVRQFVALAENDKMTIDSQLTERFQISQKNNTIVLHIHRLLTEAYDSMLTYLPEQKLFVKFTDKPNDFSLGVRSKIIIYKKSKARRNLLLRDIGIQNGDKINILKAEMIKVSVKRLTGYIGTYTISTTCHIIDLMEKIREDQNVPLDQQNIIFNNKLLQEHELIYQCDIKNDSILFMTIKLGGGGGYQNHDRIGMACGGLIKQKIYKDRKTSSVAEYTETYCEVIINLVADSEAGSSMSAIDYLENNLPWFQLNDENVTSVAKSNDSMMSNLNSV